MQMTVSYLVMDLRHYRRWIMLKQATGEVGRHRGLKKVRTDPGQLTRSMESSRFRLRHQSAHSILNAGGRMVNRCEATSAPICHQNNITNFCTRTICDAFKLHSTMQLCRSHATN